MDRKTRVAVVFGGKSGEHEVSLMSAASVMQAIPKNKYEVVPVGISKTGRWLLGKAATRLLDGGGAPDTNDVVVFPVDATHGLLEVDLARSAVRSERVDVVMPILHGTYGEDGTIQGLLEMADLPYVGAGVAGSAVGMDKALMKALFHDAGLPVVDTAFYLRSVWRRGSVIPASSSRQTSAPALA